MYNINMVKAISTTDNSKNTRYQHIKYSGYLGISSLGLCGITGINDFKIPKRRPLHKLSALVCLASGLWHLGAIKHWDKFFVTKNDNQN